MAFKVNISNIPEKRRIKKGKVFYFPLINNFIKYLGWLFKGKLFYIAFLNILFNKVSVNLKAFNKYKDIYKNKNNSQDAKGSN